MIKCIIFDWGGIFTQNDYPHISKSFGISIKQIINLEYKYSTKKDCSGFWKELREKYGVKKTDKQMAKIFDYEIKTGLLRYLPDFTNYHLVLLSDQVTSHTNYLEKRYKKQLALFNEVFFSNEDGMVKPYKHTFKTILKKIKFKSEDCLFIDDTPINIKNAKSLGIHTIRFKSIPQLKKDLKKFGI